MGTPESAVAGGDADFSLLFGLPEEILIHTVKFGRFTLTDIGHLRATCKTLRSFVDRFSRTINESVVSDLALYYPLCYWNFEKAARNGRVEVIRLLHAIHVRGGLHSRCLRREGPCYALDVVIKSAIRHKHWDVFVFLAENCLPTMGAGDYTAVYSDDPNNWSDEGAWSDLSRDQVLFLLDAQPKFLAGEAAGHAVQGPVRRSEPDLVTRMLPHLTDYWLAAALLQSIPLSVRCSVQAPTSVTEALYDECRRRRGAGAAEWIVSVPDAFFDFVTTHSGRTLDQLGSKSLWRVFTSAKDAQAAERLHAFGVQRLAVGERVAVIARLVENESVHTGRRALDSLVRTGDDTCAIAAARITADGVSLAVRALTERCAISALEHLAANGILTNTIPHVWPRPREVEDRHPLTPAFVDFMLAQWTESGSAYSVHDAASKWCAEAVRQGNVALLRHICRSVDIADPRFVRAAATERLAERAVVAGHSGVVSFLIDVNARIAPVKDSVAARQPSSFDLRTVPFDMTGALDAAVRMGNLRMAQTIDRRVPGLRASAASACRSRRWKLFRFVMRRLSPAERAQECGNDVLKALNRGDMCLFGSAKGDATRSERKRVEFCFD